MNTDELRRPSLPIALIVSVASALLMAWFRFVLFTDTIIPLTYALALLPSLWHRRRALHWWLVAVLATMATVKAFYWLPLQGVLDPQQWTFWGMQLINLILIAAAIEAVNTLRAHLERESEALAESNAELEAANEELTGREEEIAVQNEELQQQSEELEQQTEELESQTEELQTANEDLSKREEILSVLLEVSGPFTNEDEATSRICQLAPSLVGSAQASGILERVPEGMRVRACHGFETSANGSVIPAERTLAALVMDRGESGFLEDAGQRPDLELPKSGSDLSFRSVLASPLRFQGTIVGVLEVYSTQPCSWSINQIRLLEWLALQCARVWEMARLTDEHRAIRAELIATNQDLETRVAERTAAAEELTARLRALTSDLARTEQRERHRLAQLLHDHLQQNLVAAKLQTTLLSRSGPSAVPEAVRRIEELLSEAITTSRTLTVELSPAVLHQSGLVAGLEWLCRVFREKHKLKVTTDFEPELRTDDEDLNIVLFEAAREFLFNVVKHSGVDHAGIALRNEGNAIVLTVQDDGRGFSIEGGRLFSLSGFGLFGIQQRLEALGGRLDIDTRPGDGTRLAITAPLGESSQTDETEQGLPSAAEPAFFLTSPGSDGRGRDLRLLLVDDHAIFRQGVATLLKREKGLRVVGEASDGEAALRETARLLPDVVLMDLSMPVMDGIEATRRLTAQFPDIRVIGLSMYEQADRADSMLQAGAKAYLTKDGPSENLIAAIRTAGVTTRTSARRRTTADKITESATETVNEIATP